MNIKQTYQTYKNSFYKGVNYNNNYKNNNLNELNENNKVNNHYNNIIKAYFIFKFINKLIHTCKCYKQTFKLNNYLYIHIKDNCLKKKPLFILIIITLMLILIQKTKLKILFKALTFIIIINNFNLIIKFTATNLENIKKYIFCE